MSIYDYQRPVGKIEDHRELRDEFIAVYDTKDKTAMVRFGLLYAQHLLEITRFKETAEITMSLTAMQEWLDGKTNYHKARNVDYHLMLEKAKQENDLVQVRFIKTMAQITCIPHVKAHGLWATDFAITLMNAMSNHDMDLVEKERKRQIQLLSMCYNSEVETVK